MTKPEFDLSVDEYVNVMRPYFEQEIDSQILAQPLTDRLFLMRHREMIINRYVEHVRRKNLEQRLAVAEARLKPRLVET